MNSSRILSMLTVITAVAIGSGCGQQEQPAASTAPATPAAAVTSTASVSAATPAVSDTGAAANTQAQGLIDKAKSLVDSSQYADAAKLLKELSNMQLTPEQQKIVDDLKATVQKNLAGSALGGMLGK